MKKNKDRSTPLKISLVGTRGVPAQYGGFETCVEQVGKRLADRGHDVRVYCRSSDATKARPKTFLGMNLVWLPAMRKRSLETLSHTGLSVAHLAARRSDVAFVFNAANSPWLPLVRLARIPVATHMDGLEWKRAKWGALGQKYYRFAESWGVNLSDGLIADAAGIQNYYTEEFSVPTELIKYGAPILEVRPTHRIAKLGLETKKFHVVVARFERENHVDMIVEGYSKSNAEYPLVVVGAAPYSDDYTSRVKTLANENVIFLGAVWDQDLLDDLYAHSLIYWHGHSVGGTNPSLLRAMGAAAATNAFDVDFNREVILDAGEYFSNPADVARLAEEAEANSSATIERGQRFKERAKEYDWERVADGYEELAYKLFDGTLRRKGIHRRARGLSSVPATQLEEQKVRS